VDRSGDNLLAVFPVVADSVMAAVNIQERLTTNNVALPADRQIHARIGINLGDIIDDGQRIFGDGVNVAARLQEIAPLGGICISDSARVVIGNTLSVSFQAVGEQQLRNIASTISAHLVISDSDQPRKSTHEPDDPRLSIAVLPFTSQTEMRTWLAWVWGLRLISSAHCRGFGSFL
jgi:adenylate cyclase